MEFIKFVMRTRSVVAIESASCVQRCLPLRGFESFRLCRMIVHRNVAGIGSAWDLPAFAGIVDIRDSTASFDCAIPFLG